MHSLECSPQFLILFIQEKSLDDLHNQHTEYLRKYIFCSLLSRKAAPVMTNISDLGTLILKLRAQLLVSLWHHDPSTRHVTHPAHDIMRNTHNVFKEYSTFLFPGEMFGEMTLLACPQTSPTACAFGAPNLPRLVLKSDYGPGCLLCSALRYEIYKHIKQGCICRASISTSQRYGRRLSDY